MEKINKNGKSIDYNNSELKIGTRDEHTDNFIESYFTWLNIDEQKKNANRLSNITNRNKNKNKL